MWNFYKTVYSFSKAFQLFSPFRPSSHDTSLKIWSANTYEELFSLGGHTGGISAALLISEDKAVTGSQDCSVMFWDVKSGKFLTLSFSHPPSLPSLPLFIILFDDCKQHEPLLSHTCTQLMSRLCMVIFMY